MNPVEISISQQQINDIFEVNINSNKLISILKRLQDSNLQLERKIQQINDFYQEADSALNTKIINTTNNIKTIVSQQMLKGKADIQKNMRQFEEKIIKQLYEKDLKINQVKYSAQTLNDKINKVNSSLNDEIQYQVRILSGQSFTLKRNLEKNQEKITSQMAQIIKKLQSHQTQIESNKDSIFQLQVKLKKFSDFMERPVEADHIPCPEKKFEESFNKERYSQFNCLEGQKSRLKLKKSSQKYSLNISKPIICKNGSQQQNKTSNSYYATLEYASLLEKVQKIQKKIQQIIGDKYDQGSLKRNSKTVNMKTISFSKEQVEKNLADKNLINLNIEELSQNDFITSILLKIEKLENLIDTKDKISKKYMDQIKEKYLFNDERTQFNKQKITKINLQLTQLKQKVSQNQKKTGPQADKLWISTIQNQIGMIIQRLDHQLQVKVNREEYKLDYSKTTQKLKMIQEDVIYKADKDDVKKAISFLEDKIKQVILVMANQFNDQKVCAINKQPVKCLTCDKEVFKFNNVNSFNSGGSTIRAMTSPKSSRDPGQKYINRLLKSSKTNRVSSKKIIQPYSSNSNLTQQKEQFTGFV